MKNYSQQLNTLLITQKHWRHTGSRRTIKNVLGEEMPFSLTFNRGCKDAQKGWTGRDFVWLSGSAYISHDSRKTNADIASGWGGGLSTKETRERYKRHGSIIPGNHLDNYKELNGATVTAWEHLRWGFRFVSRAFGGWTFSDTWKVPNDRKDFRGWSCGAPEWYAEHQP